MSKPSLAIASNNFRKPKKDAALGLGQFERVRDADLPPSGYVGRPPPSINARTALAAVKDPDDKSGRRRHLATASLRDDILAAERAHGRISEAAYRVGRTVQAVYEGIRDRDGNPLLNDRVDVSTTPDADMLASLAKAERIVNLHRHIERLVGRDGAAFLRAVLVDGCSFRAMAQRAADRSARLSGSRTVARSVGERGILGQAQRFRDMLEELAESWAAVAEA